MTTTHYGLEVWSDEDGDHYYVLGHPPLRRALAAANRYARVDGGLANLYDTPGTELLGYLTLRHDWMKPVPDDDEWFDYCAADEPGAQAITVVTL